jgi:hypothetical protein
MESVVYHLLSVICLLREETDRAVQKANTMEAAANDGICYLSYLSSVFLGRRQTGLYRRPTPWRRQPTMESVVCHLLSVICLLREETDRAVQKANTLEAAANDANERADKMEEKQRVFQKKLNEKVNTATLFTVQKHFIDPNGINCALLHAPDYS